jgi:hypothetical protein
MRHDWIVEVLADLLTYARRNGLPALAEQTEATLNVARKEIQSGAARPLVTGDHDAPER